MAFAKRVCSTGIASDGWPRMDKILSSAFSGEALSRMIRGRSA